MEARSENIDGINIGFGRTGKGPALLLLHGYPLDRAIWADVAAMLSADFDVIAPDLRGFGASDVMEADRSIIEYATDLAGLMERLRINKAHVVGHSMGGYVAMAFAREFANKLAGLGLVSSQVVADTPERKAARQENARQIIADGVDGVVEGMTPKLSADANLQSRIREVIGRQRPLGLSVALDAMAGRPDSTDVLKSLAVPVVIIHGTADQLIPIDRAREMRQLKPSAHYLELPGVGHMPMMENAAAVAEALRFLSVKRDKGVRLLDS